MHTRDIQFHFPEYTYTNFSKGKLYQILLASFLTLLLGPKLKCGGERRCILLLPFMKIYMDNLQNQGFLKIYGLNYMNCCCTYFPWDSVDVEKLPYFSQLSDINSVHEINQSVCE